MLAATALAIASAQGPLPGRDAVWSALDRDLNTRCDGGVESENCVSHPSAVSVRGLNCTTEGDVTARCRYERRINSVGGHPRWEAAETRFAYDGARQTWSIDRDFPLTPEPANVAGALHWEAGSVCRALIDACLDENGQDMNPLPEFTVSALACRPVADRRATCSFTSVRSFGPRDAQPSQRCTGTLQRGDDDGGRSGWTFVVHDSRRRPWAALLSCN